ncbi:MAG: 23S rRNA (guanosine(2251)-2'-O)-methyltransferase RlmB [Candidatus Muiribacteriota bacterium]
MMNLIYGKNPVYEAISAQNVEQVFTCDKKEYERLKRKKIKIVFFSREKFLKKFGKNSQNIVAHINEFKFFPLNKLIQQTTQEDIICILDHIQDPHNLGAIIRTCCCCGVKGIILPSKRSVKITPVVYKASAGALSHVKITQVTNIAKTVDLLKKNNFWIYGAFAEAPKTIYEENYQGKTALIIGSEGVGISNLVAKKIDFGVKIPMNSSVSSLNASVATGVVLFEIKRKKEKNKVK